jgi:type I restriction enzyme S subunit
MGNNTASKLDIIQACVELIPEGWNLLQVGKSLAIKNNFRKPINQEVRSTIQGVYPYYGPTKIQDYISVYEQDGTYALIGEDGDHFLKYSTMSQTQYISGKCTVNNHAHILESTKICDAEWFYIYFKNRDITNFLSRQGSGRFKLNKATLEKLPMLVPPLLEQRKITQILSTWDKAISATESLITNNQQQKKNLMQQLLTGKKRFAGFNKEWMKVRLGDMAEMNSGGTPKSSVPEYYDGEIPWVSIADMTKHGKWISHTKRSISQLGLENSSAQLYPRSSVLYAMYASIGECSIAKVELASSQAILGIRPNEGLNYLYLYYYLSSLKEKIKLQGQQGTQANLNAGMIKDFRFNIPPIEEQQKIATVLSAADQEINTLQQKLTHLKQEKKALVQQLLTGNRRVLINIETEADHKIGALNYEHLLSTEELCKEL